MGAEYDWDTRQRAEELYILEGLTYQQVADRTGVSIQQLQRWGGPDAGGWAQRKRERREALNDIRRYELEAVRGLMERAAKSLDPQTVYAARAMSARLLKAEDEDRKERFRLAAEKVEQLVTNASVPPDTVKQIREQIYGLVD